jgi:selenocysteine-specific elongation factor
MGLVVAVAGNRFFPPAAVRRLAGLAEQLAAEGALTAAVYKDRSGIGRNVTIELLEFFDRQGFTRRAGDARSILRPAAELFGTG